MVTGSKREPAVQGVKTRETLVLMVFWETVASVVRTQNSALLLWKLKLGHHLDLEVRITLYH